MINRVSVFTDRYLPNYDTKPSVLSVCVIESARTEPYLCILIFCCMRTIDEENSGASSRIVRTKVSRFRPCKTEPKIGQGQVNKHENVGN